MAKGPENLDQTKDEGSRESSVDDIYQTIRDAKDKVQVAINLMESEQQIDHDNVGETDDTLLSYDLESTPEFTLGYLLFMRDFADVAIRQSEAREVT